MTPPLQEGNPTPGRKSAADFVFGKVIGEGSFSSVYLAKCIHSNKEFAIKVLDKRHILRERKAEYVSREKLVLQILGNSCNYFVRLYCTFQDKDRLYFVLTYAKNGELLQQIKNELFNIDCARFYAAELLLALEHLHYKGIVHRDLKPENVLFDENWHILVTDFGSAKILKEETVKEDENIDHQKRRRNSFVGTAQYVSPEILENQDTTYSSDLWAFGCIIYQMVSRQMPFQAGSEYLIFKKILKLEYEFPEGFDKVAKDLVEKLLVIEPEKRLGAKDETPYTSIRSHEFFKDIDFDNLGYPPNLADAKESSSQIVIPDNLEPGFDEEKMSKLQLDMLTSPSSTVKPGGNKTITDLGEQEIKDRLELQKTNEYNGFVSGNLILKQGFLYKKKGLFARRRMFLLTLGPHLYYVDPNAMILKGEIPWSKDIKPEAKNFKVFYVHTPNRTYYLEDTDGYALSWCKAIEEVKAHYFVE